MVLSLFNTAVGLKLGYFFISTVFSVYSVNVWTFVESNPVTGFSDLYFFIYHFFIVPAAQGL